jgi:hypothetical protein
MLVLTVMVYMVVQVAAVRETQARAKMVVVRQGRVIQVPARAAQPVRVVTVEREMAVAAQRGNTPRTQAQPVRY